MSLLHRELTALEYHRRIQRMALWLGGISFVLVCAVLGLLGYGYYTLLFAR